MSRQCWSLPVVVVGSRFGLQQWWSSTTDQDSTLETLTRHKMRQGFNTSSRRILLLLNNAVLRLSEADREGLRCACCPSLPIAASSILPTPVAIGVGIGDACSSSRWSLHFWLHTVYTAVPVCSILAAHTPHLLYHIRTYNTTNRRDGDRFARSFILVR